MQPTSRQAYIDWLRILAILGVLFFHSAMPFAAEEWWHIKNKQTSDVLQEFTFWLSQFRMPLLFFISGAVSYFMMQHRSAASFIGLRFRRLCLPLFFGMLIVVPPQVYMERLTQGYKGSFIDFYPSIFRGEAYPKGNTSWHHLWFIAYLFVYDLVAAPLFAWMISAKKFTQKLGWFARGLRVYLFIIPSVVLFAWLAPKFSRSNDLIHDYAYLPYWFLFLLVGFLCISNAALMDSLERNRRTSLLLGVLSFIAIDYFRWNDLHEPIFLFPMIAWFWVLALTGYGKKYLNKKNPISAYATQAVYPFYILHQTVIVILAFYVVQANDDVLPKYLFLSFTSLFLTIAIYHLLIRPYGVMRFIFGMKTAQKQQHEIHLSTGVRTAHLHQPAACQ